MLVPSFNLKYQTPQKKIGLAIFGSTGSIGESALEVVRKHKDKFKVVAITADKNFEKLAAQIAEFHPSYAGLNNQNAFNKLKDLLNGKTTETKLICGGVEISELAALDEVDTVLAAIVGFAGLLPVIKAMESGKRVALANKESIVAAGELLAEIQSRTKAEIIPVDSEHSALFQSIQGQLFDCISNLTLTASGGPFYNTPLSDLVDVTPKQAAKHPKWSMGQKISIDSATLVNKALELIEVKWLFGVEQEMIKVLVHPQSIIHSIVEFKDGSQIAQLSEPNMQGPIAYALGYPYLRFDNIVPRLDLAKIYNLTFFDLDNNKFPAVEMARESLRCGGAMPAVFNSANEAAVQQFIDGKIKFTEIYSTIENVMKNFVGTKYDSYEDLIEIDEDIRVRIIG